MKLHSDIGEKPLWSQLYDILENKIIKGEYKQGDILPSEMTLMEEYGVSRVTVRQAMDKLIIAGLISRKRGKGTIVKKNEDTVATLFKSSFNGVEEKNNSKDRRVINLELVNPTIEVAYFFDITINDSLLKLTRQTFVEGLPITHYETYLNPKLPLTKQDNFDGSLHEKLDQIGYRITRVKEKITASIMTSKEKKMFNINKNEAVMHRTRMVYSKDTPIEYTYSKYVATGYELVIDLS